MDFSVVGSVCAPPTEPAPRDDDRQELQDLISVLGGRAAIERGEWAEERCAVSVRACSVGYVPQHAQEGSCNIKCANQIQEHTQRDPVAPTVTSHGQWLPY